jgi:hypothetical protein
MRTATPVPETHELDGDDALKTLRRTGWGGWARTRASASRAADGFSHSRAVAFQITFTLLPATIVVVGLATILHAAKSRDILRHTITRLGCTPLSHLGQVTSCRGRGRICRHALASAAGMWVDTPTIAARSGGARDPGHRCHRQHGLGAGAAAR